MPRMPTRWMSSSEYLLTFRIEDAISIDVLMLLTLAKILR